LDSMGAVDRPGSRAHQSLAWRGRGASRAQGEAGTRPERFRASCSVPVIRGVDE
jgi:hypothetical protein